MRGFKTRSSRLQRPAAAEGTDQPDVFRLADHHQRLDRTELRRNLAGGQHPAQQWRQHHARRYFHGSWPVRNDDSRCSAEGVDIQSSIVDAGTGNIAIRGANSDIFQGVIATSSDFIGDTILIQGSNPNSEGGGVTIQDSYLLATQAIKLDGLSSYRGVSLRDTGGLSVSGKTPEITLQPGSLDPTATIEINGENRLIDVFSSEIAGVNINVTGRSAWCRSSRPRRARAF